MECVCEVRFILRNLGYTIIKYINEITIDSYKLRYKEDNEITVETTITLKDLEPDADLAQLGVHIREIIERNVYEKILPILVLVSSTGFHFDPNSIVIKIVCKDKGKVILSGVLSNTVTIKVKAIIKVSKGKLQEEIDRYKELLDNLDADTRKDLTRAIRFWNRGYAEEDPIDKFINYYIAFEIIGKNLLGYGNAWVTNTCKKYQLTCEFEEHKVNNIRAALLHAKTKNLTKEEAEKLAIKYAETFGHEILKLIKTIFSTTIATT